MQGNVGFFPAHSRLIRVPEARAVDPTGTCTLAALSLIALLVSGCGPKPATTEAAATEAAAHDTQRSRRPAGSREGEASDAAQSPEAAAAPPNIVYILADDLGYGDVSAYNPHSKIPTPNIDRLAAQGVRFTDAHSAASVCTPSRYAILTGEYGWRSRLSKGVLRGYGRALIEQDTLTVAELLGQEGYRTGMVGKWHLGVDWPLREGVDEAVIAANADVNENGVVTEMDPALIDFERPVANGPLTHGFDEAFFLPASLDMPPYVYIRGDTLVSPPSEETPGNDLDTGYTGAFWRAGGIAPDFEIDEVLPDFTREAVGFIERQEGAGDPFFLYLAFASPHTPWLPDADHDGRTGAGDYGDFVAMTDTAVGRVLEALEVAGLADDTLVVFTSDNGPYWRPDRSLRFAHDAAGPFRGMKADIWEGGHRVPFIVRWPGVAAPGRVASGITVQTNLLATVADVIGRDLPPDAARDSRSILAAVRGDAAADEVVVHHSSKDFYAVREGRWKLATGLGSGGFSLPDVLEPVPGGPAGQLYDLRSDPAETTNLYSERPEVVARLSALLEDIREAP